MWGGLISAIPTGWNLCDGTLGTPDLRSKFIKGSAAGINPGATGGSATAAYTPAGTNSAPTFTGNALSTHTHTFTASSNAASPKLMTANTSSGVAASGTSGATSAGTPSGSVSAPNFTGTPASIPTEPAYYSLCFIQKA